MLINQSIISEIKSIISQARDNVIRSVDAERTIMYWHIGKRIFEEEQQGKHKANYGNYLTQFIALQLKPEYGSGFSTSQLNLYRQFYRTFPIVHTLSVQLSIGQYQQFLKT